MRVYELRELLKNMDDNGKLMVDNHPLSSGMVFKRHDDLGIVYLNLVHHDTAIILSCSKYSK